MLLAYIEGNYYPCIIVSRARSISNGYLVFFLHSQCETEIPSCNVIGNFQVYKPSFNLQNIIHRMLFRPFKTATLVFQLTENFIQEKSATPAAVRKPKRPISSLIAKINANGFHCRTYF